MSGCPKELTAGTGRQNPRISTLWRHSLPPPAAAHAFSRPLMRPALEDPLTSWQSPVEGPSRSVGLTFQPGAMTGRGGGGQGVRPEAPPPGWLHLGLVISQRSGRSRLGLARGLHVLLRTSSWLPGDPERILSSSRFPSGPGCGCCCFRCSESTCVRKSLEEQGAGLARPP